LQVLLSKLFIIEAEVKLYSHPYRKDELGDDFFKRVLIRFPGNRSLTVAYGSGVFQQHGAENVRKNMTDFIIAVDDPISWHKQNLQINPKDYAGLVNKCSWVWSNIHKKKMEEFF
jgi:hypothetical protein